ncbi:MAG: signal peptidase II [Proteobacteria bacterium]|nr:signal peptidase II [Pseudomonadota bacterium]
MKKAIAIILSVVLMDQLIKGILLYLAMGHAGTLSGGFPFVGNAFDLVPNPGMWPPVTNFFNLVFTWNPGTSFSLFQHLGISAPLIIIILTGVIIGVLGYVLTKTKVTHEQVALGLIIGGAMGNLIDRLRFNAVIDFLDFHVGGWHWPAFNFADSMITVGVAIFIIGWVFGKKVISNK